MSESCSHCAFEQICPSNPAHVFRRAVYHDNLKIHARVLASLGIEGHWPAKLAT
jgi:hypothetical protein